MAFLISSTLRSLKSIENYEFFLDYKGFLPIRGDI
jgi:hypothetical protein